MVLQSPVRKEGEEEEEKKKESDVLSGCTNCGICVSSMVLMNVTVVGFLLHLFVSHCHDTIVVYSHPTSS